MPRIVECVERYVRSCPCLSVSLFLKIEIDSPNWQLVCHEGSNYIHYIKQSCFVQTGWHWWHSKMFCGLIYNLFKCYVHGRNLHSSLDMASFDLLFKRLKDCLTVKHAVVRIISGRKDKYMIVTDLTCLMKIVNIACFYICGIIIHLKWFWCGWSALSGDAW